MSFLSAFTSILHAAESAALIAAPIIKAVNPEVGMILTMATGAAVGVEAAIPAAKAGATRKKIVKHQTQAMVDVTNAILASQGKAPLPSNITDIAMQQVDVVVSGLNASAKLAAKGAGASASK